ncbi:cell wall-binding repeat-containing protein [Euzebya pacifica]|uniref:cell wall-binding repeat-containing protein n=1 Tax=Euzebya pacifica TaxID=1608957 RepID=UPI0030F67CE8
MRLSTRPLSLLWLVPLLLLVPLLGTPLPATAQGESVRFAAFAPLEVARPGDVVTVGGHLATGDLADRAARPVPATDAVEVSLHAPTGEVFPLGTAVPDADGLFTVDIPAELTAGRTIGTARNGYRETWAVRAVAADGTAVAGAGAVTFAQAAGVQVDHDFTSSVGWVKPGEEFPSRVIVSNFDATPVSGLTVTIPAVDGRAVTEVRTANGDAAIGTDGTLTWTLGELAAASETGPARATLVVISEADTTTEDPQIVWKDLSATATLSTGATSTSHGPKVIPPAERFDTARYGDRPFPVVPVQFLDFAHAEDNRAELLDTIINDPANPGSTFNLFQEMSYGQLFPNGTVPSAGIETADFAYDGTEGEGVDFHKAQIPPPSTCTGLHSPDLAGTPLYPERISDGWYTLPGTTGYYGADSGGTALAPALGVPIPASIDAGCGDTGKAVYDAAAIADPEIDYNEYDTDKDGVVDFFMMIFVGCGGNGESQLTVAAGCQYFPGGIPAPYDNIWPHSSTLEGGFRDPGTGLLGYVSDDRLTDLEGNLLFYTDATYTVTTTTETEFPAYVRVGPYNVNPEGVFDAASVISHEYGHSLGLPDFYSNAGLTTYGEWNLMAADYSQHMDAFGRQELGWVVPLDVPEGTTEVEMVGSKTDINRIEWASPDGTPYVLEGEDVHNGQMYRAGIPTDILIDPALVENGASPTHVYWSTSGNDYACPSSPNARALDLRVPALADLAADTPVELSFATMFDIEWEFDYGFVMVTTDDGQTYTALESEEGFTTPATTNPNNNVCHATYGNGITGTTQSYEDGTSDIDRLVGNAPENDGFATDRYDLTAYAGQDNVVIRFGYVTDVGLAEQGWFIDDVTVTADGQELYANDFEDGASDPLLFNGGCDPDSGLGTAPICSKGFQYVSSTEGSPADHAYYLELRDRSGFDADGFGQSDRGAISWEPGISLGYTDESFSYGNISNGDHPGQHVLDAVPVPGDTAPELADAAFNVGESFSDAGEGHVDNFEDPQREDGFWRFDFECLSFDVTAMSGDEVTVDDSGAVVSPREDDITATVSLTRGTGCAPIDYGYEGNLGLTVERLAGPGRVQTAVEVSQRAFPNGADTVLLADAGNFPDALAAAPLAADLDAPVLLTPAAELAAEVATELERLGATDVVLLGGEAALSAAVENALSDYEVTRLAGSGRVETSVEVAEALAGEDGEVPGAILVRADAFPDALAASNLAIPNGLPILLTGSSGLDAAAEAALDDLVADGAVVYLAGGTAALTEQVATDVAAAGFVPKRLSGASRYATAAAITQEALTTTGASFGSAMLASGTNFPDALTAGPAAAQLGGMLVLVDPGSLDASPESRSLLSANAGSIRRLFIAGGTAAVSQAVQDQAVAVLGG